ncbi:uncharacterized protein LOC123529251 isoform X2 [Mercenaria mercenaria]|uniref:uncharacterized protein LOC123529251 isoform X2 n=1 Tax=Mercenaria mercenaria TaxID=6596 RepID=UPI001E1D3E33|nr:uncharacterized protein LOC123529251 isoform X2 [Mercenaria mercenaria]
MGNVEVHNLSPVREDERKELNLSRKLNYKQYCRHVEGRPNATCLRELPWNIRDSVSLYERMNAAFNALTELPNELSVRLPHLNYLDLSYNQLEALPDSFGLLFHLETLNLKFNRVKTLPHSFYHLVKLTKIDVSHNCLKMISADVIQLEKLIKLNVSFNKLKSLPVSLGGLKYLKVLLADNNRFPESLVTICNNGSDELLSHLRKNYNLQMQSSELLSSYSHNVFPRVRGNHLLTSVPNPHSAQVQYIQSQTHTANTSNRIKTPLLPPQGASSLDANDLKDKILGLIYGAAIGDAICISTCCMSADECHFHYNSDGINYTEIVQDELRVRWKQGDWTSNFDTMVLLLDSIVSWAGVIDELEYARRLKTWCQCGYPELGDEQGIVLSETTKQLIEKSEFLIHPHQVAQQIIEQSSVHVIGVKNGSHVYDNCSTGSTTSDVSSISEIMGQGPLYPSSHPTIPSRKFGTDNGAVVSIAILGVPGFHVSEEVEANTVRICKTTHSRPVCISSCLVITSLISQMLQCYSDQNCCKAIEEMINKAAVLASKYITQADELDNFNRYINYTSVNRSFMMNLLMEGGDSNSNGCVAGALLGCKVGYSRLPKEWISGLRKKQTTWLNVKINLLLDMMGLP